MQLPNAKTPVARCEGVSRFAQGAMRAYPAIFSAPAETATPLESLAATLETATSGLMSRQQAYHDAVLSLISPRVALKIVDLRADELVRSIKRADDDAGPAVSSALFPNGLTPIIRPVGHTQAAELRALEGRVAAASSWEGGAAQLARLTPVREAYETALQNRQDGMIAAGNQRALRDAAKEDFLTAFAEVAASIQQIFPRDRRRQDVFFDEVRSRRTVSAGDDPVTDDDDPAPDDE